MDALAIRTYGDPVLKKRASEVADVDGRLKELADAMLFTTREAPGVGLAAPQVGISRRMFVYDLDGAQGVVINPVVVEAHGEWTYTEGCLSVPGLSWDITRPKEVHLTGYDLDGNEVSIEADELLARLFQHEVDHLDGVLLLERLDDDQRREAIRILRERNLGTFATSGGPIAVPSPGSTAVTVI